MNKNYKLRLVLSISLVLIVHTLFAQTVADCKQAMEQAFQRYTTIETELLNGNTLYFDYSVQTDLRHHENEAKKERVEALINLHQMEIKSKYMELYVDEIYSFTVLPQEKKVMWGASSMGFGKDIQKQLNLQAQAVLLGNSEVKGCAFEKENVLKVDLVATSKGKQLLHFDNATFWVDTQQQIVKRMITYLLEPLEAERFEIEFHQFDVDYKGDKRIIDFMQQYLSSKQLKGRLATYELVDVR